MKHRDLAHSYLKIQWINWVHYSSVQHLKERDEIMAYACCIFFPKWMFSNGSIVSRIILMVDTFLVDDGFNSFGWFAFKETSKFIQFVNCLHLVVLISCKCSFIDNSTVIRRLVIAKRIDCFCILKMRFVTYFSWWKRINGNNENGMDAKNILHRAHCEPIVYGTLL